MFDVSKKLFCLMFLVFVPFGVQAKVPEPVDTPYEPGVIRLEVDATDVSRHVFRAKETIPVKPGELTLLFPQWLPGKHAAAGTVDKLAGLVIRANGQKLDWHRDPTDVHAFRLTVPQGASQIIAEYQYMTPANPSQGRVVMTPHMLNLQFEMVSLYPAGHYTSQIIYDASVTYPKGWGVATALDVASKQGNTIRYKPVRFDVLQDSPVFAGAYMKRFDLTPKGKKRVTLNVVADAARYLEADPEHMAIHRKLVEQSLKLFGSEHYDHYDFLLALTEQMSRIGLEHQRSSENALPPNYFTEWDQNIGSSSLLSHEIVHSWNGKYRRPADMWTPNFNELMQGSLLWVYEGQTQFWGEVLAARSDLRPIKPSLEKLAMIVAQYTENRPGLMWRSVQDTTNDPVIAQRRPNPYRNFEMSEEYYNAGMLIWYGVDAKLRALTRGKKNMDDFALAFFGVKDGEWEDQNTYTFDDVIAELNKLAPYDWAKHLRDQLDGKVPFNKNIEAHGWRLVFKDKPSDYAAYLAATYKRGAYMDFIYSLGLTIAPDGGVTDVRWDSPAFQAGIGSGSTIIAVNGLTLTEDELKNAVREAQKNKKPIKLTVKQFNKLSDVSVRYTNGLRYPHLERIKGTKDTLTEVLSPK